MKVLWRILLCSMTMTLVLAAGCQKQQDVSANSNLTSEVNTKPENKEEPEEEILEEEEDDRGVLRFVEQKEYISAEGIELEAGTYIAVVGRGSSSDFWKNVKEGAAQAIKDLNAEMGYTGNNQIYMTYDSPSEEDNVEQQINVLDEALASYPDALCISISDMQAFQSQLDYAVENSISVVSFESGLDDEKIQALSATDNDRAAKEAARNLCEMIGGSGQVAAMVHSDILKTGLERQEAFRKVVEEEYPEIEIVDISYLNDAEKEPEEIIQGVISRYPGLKGYFTTDANSFETVSTVCGEHTDEEQDIMIVSFGSDSSQIKGIRNGKLAGTIVQNPYAMGYTTVIAAARAIMEEEVEPFISTGYLWVTQELLDDEDVKELLY